MDPVNQNGGTQPFPFPREIATPFTRFAHLGLRTATRRHCGSIPGSRQRTFFLVASRARVDDSGADAHQRVLKRICVSRVLPTDVCLRHSEQLAIAN
jgi:hypothetical protein